MLNGSGSLFESLSSKENFVADALEVVRLKFGQILRINQVNTPLNVPYNLLQKCNSVNSDDDFEKEASYTPEFAHQHFGDSYANLNINSLIVMKIDIKTHIYK